jgi:Sel1 repeat
MPRRLAGFIALLLPFALAAQSPTMVPLGSSVNQVGWIYRNGLGVPVDNAEALKWLRMAADAGMAAV